MEHVLGISALAARVCVVLRQAVFQAYACVHLRLDTVCYGCAYATLSHTPEIYLTLLHALHSAFADEHDLSTKVGVLMPGIDACQ